MHTAYLHTDKRITDEVRRIMGPSSSKSLGYSSSNSALIGTSEINRKKRKSNMKLVYAAKKGRVSTASFQKKLVVFKYMGADGPDMFTRADKRIAMRGLLPPIPVDASEVNVRQEICDVIRSCTDYRQCGPDDFEFIDMNGKQASIPNCKAGFLWDGRAVKELAGSGCLYVRFTSDIGESDDSSSSDERKLPKISVKSNTSDDVRIVKEIPATTSGDVRIVKEIPATSALASQNVAAGHSTPSPNLMQSREQSFSGHNVGQLHVPPRSSSTCRTALPSTSADMSPSPPPRIPNDANDEDIPSAFQFVYEKPDESKDLAKLTEIFPQLTAEQLKYVYSLPMRNRFDSTVSCLMEGPTLEALRSLAVMQLVIPLSESPYIRVDAEADDEEMVGAALAYYKHDRFNKAAYVRISMKRQPGIDTGGIRRQFFAIVFSEIALSRSVQVFDGPVNRLRPSFRASNLSSGLLSTIGTMIAHSFLMDGYAFPYLSEYCYYYMAGYSDKALTCITIDDVGEQVKQLVQQVCVYTVSLIIGVCATGLW